MFAVPADACFTYLRQEGSCVMHMHSVVYRELPSSSYLLAVSGWCCAYCQNFWPAHEQFVHIAHTCSTCQNLPKWLAGQRSEVARVTGLSCNFYNLNDSVPCMHGSQAAAVHAHDPG